LADSAARFLPAGRRLSGGRVGCHQNLAENCPRQVSNDAESATTFIGVKRRTQEPRAARLVAAKLEFEGPDCSRYLDGQCHTLRLNHREQRLKQCQTSLHFSVYAFVSG
jgi:hypothetical protein